MKSLVEIVNFIMNFSLLDQLNQIIFNWINGIVEFLSYLWDRNNFVCLNMLLQSFEANISENSHLFVITKVNIILKLILDGNQTFLKLQIISIQEMLNDIWGFWRCLS
jgi:hypothetical protein